jgi:hypothetical protein
MAKILTEVTGASYIMRDWKEFPAAVKKIEESMA